MRILRYLFLLIFTLQFNAQASRLFLPNSPEVLAALVESFNGLSPEEKTLYVKSVLDAADPRFLKTHTKAIDSLKWPELEMLGDEFRFRVDGQTVTLKVLGDGQFLLNGRESSLRKKHFASGLERAQRILETPKTSFLDFFISSAHAFVPIVIALLAVAVAALLLYPAVSVIKAAFLKVKCLEIRQELDDMNPGTLTASQASDLRSKVRRLLEDNTRDLSRAQDPGTKRELEHNRYCYEQLSQKIDDVYPDQISGGDRGGFFERLFSSPKRTSPAVSPE